MKNILFTLLAALLITPAQVKADPIIVWPLKSVVISLNADELIILTPSDKYKARYITHIIEKSNGEIKAYGYMKACNNGYFGYLKDNSGHTYRTYLQGNNLSLQDVTKSNTERTNILECSQTVF